jgi:glyoxylase-like metal-dependent hydrolase (beta-lactamase superfamily II)
MNELKKVGEKTYYIDSPSKVGIYKMTSTDVCLIDSGNDKDFAKKILKILQENQWELKAIINTHSNADHIGGNQYLQEKTNCPIYTKGIEKAFTGYPILEPSFLYGGYPYKELRNKFLMAKESSTIEYTNQINGLEIFDLKGHFFDMIGIKTSDNVYFIADCVSSQEILNKYHIRVYL